MSLVARAWDPRLVPAAEFRGICWGGNSSKRGCWSWCLYSQRANNKQVPLFLQHSFRAVDPGKLTCLCQYFHPLYFEDLQSPDRRGAIERDCIAAFKQAEKAVAALGGNCIIDFAWLQEVGA